MRGSDIQYYSVFSTVSLKSRLPKDRPLRPIGAMTDVGLRDLVQDSEAVYAGSGRDSIPPEKLPAELLRSAVSGT